MSRTIAGGLSWYSRSSRSEAACAPGAARCGEARRAAEDVRRGTLAVYGVRGGRPAEYDGRVRTPCIPPRAARVVAALALAAGGCGGGAPRAIRVTGMPEVYDARVVAARGPIVPQRGDACTIELRRTDDRYYNCRIRVECGGDVVYGLADGGYNACYQRGSSFVFARDRNGTRVDGDPRLYFDLVGGRVFVSDDAPDVELEIDLSGLPSEYDGAGSRPPPDAIPGA